jgi:NAD(P)-dependent dehydrogenase (short-subunit alcohol dehydrogenase family)
VAPAPIGLLLSHLSGLPRFGVPKPTAVSARLPGVPLPVEAPRQAVVTGADSGIGKATAVALARAGFDVGITYRSDEAGATEAAEAVRAAGRTAATAHLDLARPETGAAVVHGLVDELGGLALLVNNAGAMVRKPFLETTLDDLRSVLDVDLLGAFACAQAAARHLAAGGGGRIVNVTSIHEHVPLREASAYCAAKAGLGLATKVMALELAQYGITVNAIAPGQIATEMGGTGEGADPEAHPRPNIPLGRPGSPDEIASLIVWLTSPGAAYATGSSFVVDGGMTLIAADFGNQGED